MLAGRRPAVPAGSAAGTACRHTGRQRLCWAWTDPVQGRAACAGGGGRGDGGEIVGAWAGAGTQGGGGADACACKQQAGAAVLSAGQVPPLTRLAAGRSWRAAGRAAAPAPPEWPPARCGAKPATGCRRCRRSRLRSPAPPPRPAHASGPRLRRPDLLLLLFPLRPGGWRPACPPPPPAWGRRASASC